MEAKLVFVFSTRGSQWPGMGRELYEKSDAFRDTLTQCDRVIQQRLGWSLNKVLQRSSAGDHINSSEEHLEPVLTAIQLGLCEVLRSHGVLPDAVLGMSGGEFAAAYAAGALSAEDAMEVSCSVSLMIRKRLGVGGMVWVNAGRIEVESLLPDAPKPLYVSAELGPAMTILSAEERTIRAALQFLSKRGLRHGHLRSEFGFHSPLVDCWKINMVRALEGLHICPPCMPVYSSAIGGLIQRDMSDTQHWWKVVRKPALYARAVSAIIEDGYDHFLEIGPHPIVSKPIQEIAAILGKKVCLIASMRSDQPFHLVLRQSLQSLCSSQPS
jgi:acyl transferase domain-containing protein